MFKVEKEHKSGVRAGLSKKDVQNMMHFKEAKVVRQDYGGCKEVPSS